MAEKTPQFSLPSDLMESAKLLQLFDCPVCLQVPEPPIILCQEGHSICNKCRIQLDRCPLCQQFFTTARNLLAEQFVQSFKRKCTLGCDKIVAACEWEMHAAQCDFRQVECDLLQKKTCFNVKMNYKKYFKHLTGVHCVEGIKGAIINVSQFVTFQQSRLNSEMVHGMWPVQYMDACNDIFLTGTSAVPGKIFWWVYVIGNDETANKYMAKVSLTLKTKHYEQSWTGPVHSFRTSPDQILKQGLCLLATAETLDPFIYMKVQQTTNPEENQPNVGWNLTFSIMKKEKMFPIPSIPIQNQNQKNTANKSFKASSTSHLDSFGVRLENMKISQSPNTTPSRNNIALQHLPFKVEASNQNSFTLKTEVSSPVAGPSLSPKKSKQKAKMKKEDSTSQFNTSG